MIGDAPARVRMFAGPNGSGKSTLVRLLAKEFNPNGVFHVQQYVNADDLQAQLAGSGIDFSRFGFTVDPADLMTSVERGNRVGPGDPALGSAHWVGPRFLVPNCDSYMAAAVADFLRERLLQTRRSFAFETVMSHRSKVEFFQRAAELGCRTYLHFVATGDPALNISRVRRRIRLGGHDVSDEKIVARYHRTLELLADALKAAYRAFLFDNSDNPIRWLAEKEPDGRLILKVSRTSLPQWFLAHVPHGTEIVSE